MSAQRQGQILARDAGAVVADTDQTGAALAEFDVDAVGTGIQTVFQQFLDHRSRTFDDFPGGDLVGQLRRQLTNAWGVGHGQDEPGIFSVCPTRMTAELSPLCVLS